MSAADAIRARLALKEELEKISDLRAMGGEQRERLETLRQRVERLENRTAHLERLEHRIQALERAMANGGGRP